MKLRIEKNMDRFYTLATAAAIMLVAFLILPVAFSGLIVYIALLLIVCLAGWVVDKIDELFDYEEYNN
jgi:fatty acid desaturase